MQPERSGGRAFAAGAAPPQCPEPRTHLPARSYRARGGAGGTGRDYEILGGKSR